MGLQELKSDASSLIQQLASMSTEQFDVKAQLTDNILPLMIGMCEAVQEGVEADVADLEEAVDGLLDQDGDLLQPETAAEFLKFIGLGLALAKELTAALPKLDDVSKKRVRALLHQHRQQAEAIGQVIAEITIPVDPEEGEPEVTQQDALDAMESEHPEEDADDDADGGEGG